MSIATDVLSDLERRKRVRIALRPDLHYSKHVYEGRTYHVVKDPVSLRYYRFKEQERFVLDLMDGEHTLEEIQKAYEQRFPPERLTFEELENFVMQLLMAGLAENQSPRAGQLLYERYRKRRRQTILGSLFNILYIKMPVFDPDRLLDKLVKPLGFVFTGWFFAISVLFMLAALFLVASQWRIFLSKLPAYHAFFSFTTLLYLWAALGLVKIVHEFGHGLSCKKFGGEVHEMGVLLLVFSPCLYCNVTDAWTLPNKWHRIIIGAAGIYVELIIASLATFIWWHTDSGTFVNNLCLSLMFVCSVSTIVFNANPLMRFDGYYVLADWLEIPNLRERANRFVQNLFMKYGLGMELPPEQPMPLWRKGFFVTYAVTSYIYRWFVTFAILYFMYTFLQPYKLGVLSFMLGTAAVGVMVGWPAYKLTIAYRKRGRLPDMKRWRVAAVSAGVAALVAAVFALPVPVRIRSLAVVQVLPEGQKAIVVPQLGGYLQALHVRDGQTVKRGDLIATLVNPDLDLRCQTGQRELASRERQLAALDQLLLGAGRLDARIQADIHNVVTEMDLVKQELDALHTLREQLILRAPEEGVVCGIPTPEEVGKWYDPGTVLGRVCQLSALRVVFPVESPDRKLLRPGTGASIHIHGTGFRRYRGFIRDISAIEAREIPPQLSNRSGGEVPTQPDPEKPLVSEKPQRQLFLVSVVLSDADEAVHPGVLARVRVDVERHTLWWRLQRYLATTFNWGL
ncbi:MAG: hypothetical protein C4297_02805 [Gemmataceae bacterium]